MYNMPLYYLKDTSYSNIPCDMNTTFKINTFYKNAIKYLNVAIILFIC